MYYVYLIKLSNNQIYTGSTPDLRNRIEEHQRGYAKSTKSLRPIKLIWYGCFETRLLARRFEKYLKTGSGKAFLNKRLT